MRIPFALAVVTFAMAAPVHAQRGPEVHRGDGYEIGLPAKARPMATSQSRSLASGGRAEMQLLAVNQNTVVMVMRSYVEELQDTTMATRRAMLHLARVGMLRAASDEADLTGEPQEFEVGDRVGVRIPITVRPGRGRNFTLRGTAEVSVARQGEAVIWMVMVIDQRDDSGARAGVDRVLASFRLTEAAPRIAERSPAERKGSAEASDLAAKP